MSRTGNEEKTFYYTIGETATAEFKDRGSRFIAFVFPVKTEEEVKQQIRLLKKEHPKAVHHCFAYRLGTDGNSFRQSDDGEPSGTAGRPILGQIDSKELIDVLVVVVRYFGGTLLGVPGLINAYKTATAMVLQLIPILKKAVEQQVELEFNYDRLHEAMLLIKQYNCTVLKKEETLFCFLRIGLPVQNSEAFFRDLENLPEVRVTGDSSAS